MATRPIFIHSDKASTNLVTAGNALTAELCTQAFPESSSKREIFQLRTLAPTSGATAAEAFIDGVQSFRFRIAERSTCMLKMHCTYNNNVAANNTGFEVTVVAQNVGGTVTILGTPLQVKYPAASTANIAISVDASNQALIFSCAGVAGDANGRWNLQISNVSEVTDLG